MNLRLFQHNRRYASSLSPAVVHLLQNANLDVSSPVVTRIPASGPKGNLLKGDVLNYLKHQHGNSKVMSRSSAPVSPPLGQSTYGRLDKISFTWRGVRLRNIRENDVTPVPHLVEATQEAVKHLTQLMEAQGGSGNVQVLGDAQRCCVFTSKQPEKALIIVEWIPDTTPTIFEEDAFVTRNIAFVSSTEYIDMMARVPEQTEFKTVETTSSMPLLDELIGISHDSIDEALPILEQRLMQSRRETQFETTDLLSVLLENTEKENFKKSTIQTGSLRVEASGTTTPDDMAELLGRVTMLLETGTKTSSLS